MTFIFPDIKLLILNLLKNTSYDYQHINITGSVIKDCIKGKTFCFALYIITCILIICMLFLDFLFPGGLVLKARNANVKVLLVPGLAHFFCV